MLSPHLGNHPISIPSANTVVPFIMDLLEPRSVLDIGCGAGAWSAAFISAGVDDVTGVDAAWARPALLIKEEHFIEANLTRPLFLDRKFDLAISLEVAEHLPAEAAKVFVTSLCSHADLVVFSAAPPGQTGPGHVNMRWPTYWAELFRDQGLYCADVFRAHFWLDERVGWWYRQNLLLFGTTLRLESLGISPAAPVDMAHPELIVSLENQPASFTQIRKAAAHHLVRRPGSWTKRHLLRR